MSDPEGYSWSPTEIQEWRLWADNQPDSITRNKIHDLLDSYEQSDKTEGDAGRAQELAHEALEIVKELTPVIRAGIRKNATPESREQTESLIRELVEGMMKILKWEFPADQKETILTLDNRPKP